jgi:aminoglycoside phosphotransferase (APT) family kinase protein
MPDPLLSTVEELGRRIGVDLSQARLLRRHDANTFLAPDQHLVVRLVPASDEALTRATKAVQLTEWLAAQPFPTVRPAITDALALDGYVATVWHEIPAAPSGRSLSRHRALGHLLRELHALPDPPLHLPTADPLARLRGAMEADSQRAEPILGSGDRTYLCQRADELQRRYAGIPFPLGVGLIHNDAHPGNLLPVPGSPHGYVLTDWEGACLGPREMDVVLAGAPDSRFGDTDDERLAFVVGYGYDIATWPEYRILRDIRDLHSLAAYIRTAPGNRAVSAELRGRIASLRDSDRTVTWHSV